MTSKTITSGPLLTELLTLEKQVWAALVAGDAQADGALLTQDFLGVYTSGRSDKAGHMAALDNGPSMDEFALSDISLRIITDDAALLTYRADYRAANSADWQVMFITSLWERENGRWLNSFSQDTPAA